MNQPPPSDPNEGDQPPTGSPTWSGFGASSHSGYPQQPGGQPQWPQSGGQPQWPQSGGQPQWQQPGGFPQVPPPPQWQDQRNWFARHASLSALAALVAVLFVIAFVKSAGGGNGATASNVSTFVFTTAAPATTASSSPATSAPAAPGGRALPIQVGDWKLTSVQPRDDGLGYFEAGSSIAYTGTNSFGGSSGFKLIIFTGGKEVARLDGFAFAETGSTASVRFFGTDKFVAGPYTYDLQIL